MHLLVKGRVDDTYLDVAATALADVVPFVTTSIYYIDEIQI